MGAQACDVCRAERAQSVAGRSHNGCRRRVHAAPVGCCKACHDAGMTRQFAASCENNQQPIAQVLATALADCRHVLEIGSGTGQHSVYLAPRLPYVVWQCSDAVAQHASIAAWHAAQPAPNLRAPLALTIGCAQTGQWPVTADGPFDAVFTSNTLHIMAWPQVQQLLALAGKHLPCAGKLVVYGPFNEGGQYTSPSNQAFDAWLKSRDPASGIRDKGDLVAVASAHGLQLQQDHAMPANNRILVWVKQGHTVAA